MRRLVIAALGASLGGCLSGVFRCEGDAQCGEGGQCIGGYCAFGDTACDSGLRYHGSATRDLAGECVVAGGSGTGGAVSTGADDDATSQSSTGTGFDCAMPPCGCATAIAAGDSHSCAIRAQGDLVCWGENSAGEVGNGTTASPVATPTVVPLPGAPAVVRAYENTCALVGGAVQCWGRNHRGMTEPGAPDAPVVDPTAVALPGLATNLFLGKEHTCVTTAQNTVGCWGDSDSGELGGGAGTEPGPVEVDVPATTIAAGQHHTCALRGIDVLCWGDNSADQLGQGTGAPMQIEQPVQVALPRAALTLDAADTHTCAVLDGTPSEVACWGANDIAQLGIGETSPSSPIPVMVGGDGFDGVIVQFDARRDRSCVLTDVGSIYCWGHGSRAVYALDVEFATPIVLPARFPHTDEIPGVVVEITHGGNHMCARTDSGRVFCWGDNNRNAAGPMSPPEGSLVVEVDLDC